MSEKDKKTNKSLFSKGEKIWIRKNDTKSE